MKIPNAKYLKNKAGIRLESGQQPKQVVMVYAAIIAGLSLLMNAVQYFVSNRMSGAGGLQNIETRAFLNTISNVLPIALRIVLVFVTFGYTAAMLRIARRQYASIKTLKAGLDRIGKILLTRVLIILILVGLAFGLSYVAMGVFMVTPFSNGFRAAILPIISEVTASSAASVDTNALVESMMYNTALMDSLLPMMIIYAVLFIPVCLILAYLYRFVDFILIDQPACSALEAMRQSRVKMRGNLMQMFKIDLSFWWYYLLRALTVLILNLDVVFAMLGIPLPGSGLVQYYGLMVLSLAADAAVTILFQNRFQVTLSLAYDAVTPKEKTDGVVLGNIFQN